MQTYSTLSTLSVIPLISLPSPISLCNRVQFYEFVGYRKELKSQIKIQASPGRVWEILSDFKSYSEWNPFITYVLGEARVGTRLDMRIRPAGSRTWDFRPKVLVSDSSRELRWLGSLWIRGLFDGEHVFNIHSLSENCVWFVQSEQFSGILVPLIPRHFWDQSLEGFRLMNEALKTRTEVWAERQSKII